MKNKHYECLIDIGVLYYEQNFYKDLINKTRISIDKLEDMIYENEHTLKSGNRIKKADIYIDNHLTYQRYSPIHTNEDTGNIDPLNFKVMDHPWELDSNNSLVGYFEAVESEVWRLKETKEKYLTIEKELKTKLCDLKAKSSKVWDELWIDLLDYSKFDVGDIEQINVIEATNTVSTNSEEVESSDTGDTDRGYLPNLKYKPELFREYFDLINIDRYNQNDAAEMVLKNNFGDDFLKKTSVESFIKRARESLKSKKKKK